MASNFEKIFNNISNRFQPWQIWADYIQSVAIAISQSVDFRDEREKLYSEIISKYDENERNEFSKLTAEVINAYEYDREQDYLGKHYMSLNLGDHWKGQFFTPYSLCRGMANLQIDPKNVVDIINKIGYITIHDAACGAGATIIAGVNRIQKIFEANLHGFNFQNHIIAVAQDLDTVTAMMCYIQLSFLGISAVVCNANSLSDPYKGDPIFYRKERNLWYTPMYFSDVWRLRARAHYLDISMR